METYANRQYFRKFLTNLSTLGQWNRSIECPDTCGTIKNGFPMKKYVGAMVRWSFQLAIAAEQGHFENKNPCTKKVQLFLPTGTLKKNKTIFILLLFVTIHLALRNPIAREVLSIKNFRLLWLRFEK